MPDQQQPGGSDAFFSGTVSGRVQGVGYRAFVVETAVALGVSGWVRNLPGGGVEVAARGPKRELTVLALTLKKGPPGARVTSVDLDWTRGPEDGVSAFEIRS